MMQLQEIEKTSKYAILQLIQCLSQASIRSPEPIKSELKGKLTEVLNWVETTIDGKTLGIDPKVLYDENWAIKAFKNCRCEWKEVSNDLKMLYSDNWKGACNIAIAYSCIVESNMR